MQDFKVHIFALNQIRNCIFRFFERNKRFQKSPLKRFFTVHKSQLCVGGNEGKDTCTGDGGSPHVCIQNEKFVQVVK